MAGRALDFVNLIVTVATIVAVAAVILVLTVDYVFNGGEILVNGVNLPVDGGMTRRMIYPETDPLWTE